MAFTGDMPQQAANSGALQCEDWVSDMLLPKESSHGFRTEISTSFMLDPLPDQVLQRQDEREQAARLTIGNEYLEMVERIAEATPPNLQEMVARQLTQLNCMAVPALADAAAISLQGDQYPVCTYPHFVSDDSAETSHMSCNWNAVICTYPHSLKEGAPRCDGDPETTA
ncbi:hypothetical protein V8E54_000253 [Elaphomyces granulatus]